MGVWRVKAISNNEGIDKIVWEDFYKFANFAKADIEKQFKTPSLKWKAMRFTQHLTVSTGYYSNTIDNITFDYGKTYHNKVTFFLESIYPRSK